MPKGESEVHGHDSPLRQPAQRRCRVGVGRVLAGTFEWLAGQTVLSVPSFSELERRVDELRRVLRQAGTGTQPLVVLVGAAEEIEERLATAGIDAA
jgi:hypothetical protein